MYLYGKPFLKGMAFLFNFDSCKFVSMENFVRSLNLCLLHKTGALNGAMAFLKQ